MFVDPSTLVILKREVEVGKPEDADRMVLTERYTETKFDFEIPDDAFELAAVERTARAARSRELYGLQEADEKEAMEILHRAFGSEDARKEYGLTDEFSQHAVAKAVAQRLETADARYTFVQFIRINSLKACVEVLTPYLEDPEPNVRAETAKALAAFGARHHAPRIADLLKDNSPHVRGSAATALGELGSKEHIGEIESLLGDADDRVRSGAVKALGYLGAKEHAKDIAPLLAERPWEKKWFLLRDATEALGRLNAKEYAKDIVPFLAEGDLELRSITLGALAAMGAREYAKDMATLLRDPDMMWHRKAVLDALVKLEAKDCAKEIAELLDIPNISLRPPPSLIEPQPTDTTAGAEYGASEVDAYQAIEALGLLGAREYSAEIARFLKHSAGGAPEAAAIALARLGAKEFTREIAELLKQSNPSPAAYALAVLGAKEHAKELAELLNSKDSYDRGPAVWALGKLGATEYKNEILALKEDHGRCLLYSITAAEPLSTTVAAMVGEVLREWDGK